jgi:hypothetical protein
VGPVICSKELASIPGAVLVGSVKSDDLLPKGHSTRDGLDKRDHAAGVPAWEGSYQPRRTIEPDTGVAERLGPRELAGMPLDEGFGSTYLLLGE